MEEYFAEAVMEEVLSFSVTPMTTPWSGARRWDPRGARGQSTDHHGRPTPPQARSTPGSLSIHFHQGGYQSGKTHFGNHAAGGRRRRLMSLLSDSFKMRIHQGRGWSQTKSRSNPWWPRMATSSGMTTEGKRYRQMTRHHSCISGFGESDR
jgi:hypothetical protein